MQPSSEAPKVQNVRWCSRGHTDNATQLLIRSTNHENHWDWKNNERRTGGNANDQLQKNEIARVSWVRCCCISDYSTLTSWLNSHAVSRDPHQLPSTAKEVHLNTHINPPLHVIALQLLLLAKPPGLLSPPTEVLLKEELCPDWWIFWNAI